MTTPRTRGQRLQAELRAQRGRPGPDPTSPAIEVARMATMQAVGHLSALGLIETLIAPIDHRWTSAQRFYAITRILQDALAEDARRGDSTAVDALWAAITRDEETHPDDD